MRACIDYDLVEPARQADAERLQDGLLRRPAAEERRCCELGPQLGDDLRLAASEHPMRDTPRLAHVSGCLHVDADVAARREGDQRGTVAVRDVEGEPGPSTSRGLPEGSGMSRTARASWSSAAPSRRRDTPHSAVRGARARTARAATPRRRAGATRPAPWPDRRSRRARAAGCQASCVVTAIPLPRGGAFSTAGGDSRAAGSVRTGQGRLRASRPRRSPRASRARSRSEQANAAVVMATRLRARRP